MSAPTTERVPARFHADTFEGDFDALPMRSEILYGSVPPYPLEGDFHLAVSVAIRTDDAAARWRVEAIRWRRGNPGETMDLQAIALRVAAWLHVRREDVAS